MMSYFKGRNFCRQEVSQVLTFVAKLSAFDDYKLKIGERFCHKITENFQLAEVFVLKFFAPVYRSSYL